MSSSNLPDGTPVEDWMLSDRPPEQILEEYKWRGFSDGFRGQPAAAVSNYVQPQTSYFDGFKEGRETLERIQKVAQEEYPDDPMGMNKIMKKSFEYYEQHLELVRTIRIKE
jgi:hypothetical protein